MITISLRAYWRPAPLKPCNFKMYVLFCFSDPYVKVSLFRGDRDTGIIDSASTTVIKKVFITSIIA